MLAFLPVSNVTDGLMELTEGNDLPQELVPYFETHFTGGERGLPGTVEPTLPTHIWSDNQWTDDITPRASDSVEAFTANCRAQV